MSVEPSTASGNQNERNARVRRISKEWPASEGGWLDTEGKGAKVPLESILMYVGF